MRIVPMAPIRTVTVLVVAMGAMLPPAALAQNASGMIGATTTGSDAARSSAGAVKPLSSSGLTNRTYAPGTREDFERHPLPNRDRAIVHVGSMPVYVRAPVTPAYNGAGTYSTVAGQPATGRNAMSAQMMSGRGQGQDIGANPAPVP